MKFYSVRALFIVLVRCPVHKPVLTSIYGLSLSQSDQRVLSVFQSVNNNMIYDYKEIQFLELTVYVENGFLKT